MNSRFVLVSIGTDRHAFRRIIDAIDTWCTDHPEVRCLVQYGFSPAPRIASGRDFIPHDELRRLMRTADVVVSHGGPATISEARRGGTLPICMPRDPDRGEHVDRHQQRFAAHQASEGRVILAAEVPELITRLDWAIADPASVELESDDAHAVRQTVHRIARFIAATVRPSEERP